MGQNFIRTRLDHDSRRRDPVSLRRQAAHGHGGSQYRRDAGQGAVSPLDVVNAINVQNLILPAGTAKIGTFEYQVDMNGSPADREGTERPADQDGERLDHLHSRRGICARRLHAANQHRSSERPALRADVHSEDRRRFHAGHDFRASRRCCRTVEASLPEHVDIHPLSDQSIFVRASINGVVREGVIAACLTGLMILVFLGSWRSTLIIAVSIPLSVLTR